MPKAVTASMRCRIAGRVKAVIRSPVKTEIRQVPYSEYVAMAIAPSSVPRSVTT